MNYSNYTVLYTYKITYVIFKGTQTEDDIKGKMTDVNSNGSVSRDFQPSIISSTNSICAPQKHESRKQERNTQKEQERGKKSRKIRTSTRKGNT